MRFCQAFMTELHRHLGEQTDVPAGDIGVGAREIGYLFGQYKRITNRYESGVLTGKGLDWGGAQVRTEATGYGCAYFVQEMLATRGDALEQRPGGGLGCRKRRHPRDREGAAARRPRHRLLGHDRLRPRPGGHRRAAAQAAQAGRAALALGVRPTPRRDRRGSCPAERCGTSPCHVALPCATQNELTGRDAQRLIESGVRAVGEGANMPCTPEALELFARAGVLVAPAKAANAGGVATSALEMQQNASRDSWTFEQTEQRLREIMRDIHDACRGAAEAYGMPEDYLMGANIAGFERVAEAMLAQGVI